MAPPLLLVKEVAKSAEERMASVFSSCGIHRGQANR
jgi:hypothetical protein